MRRFAVVTAVLLVCFVATVVLTKHRFGGAHRPHGAAAADGADATAADCTTFLHHRPPHRRPPPFHDGPAAGARPPHHGRPAEPEGALPEGALPEGDAALERPPRRCPHPPHQHGGEAPPEPEHEALAEELFVGALRHGPRHIVQFVDAEEGAAGSDARVLTVVRRGAGSNSSELERAPGAPFVRIDAGLGLFSAAAPAVQSMAEMLEQVLGAVPHAFRVSAAPAGQRSLLTFDANSNTIFLHERVFSIGADEGADEQQRELDAAYSALPLVQTRDELTDVRAMTGHMLALVNGLRTSLWYCIACTVVLAISLPLAANLLMGELVQKLCAVYHVPAQQCAEYLVAVILVGYCLLPVFALLILKVCKLRTCSS